MTPARTDPLRNCRPLIERVYSYVAYRIGDGPEAEDVTGDVFERALRYRDSYDPAKGRPLGWLLGIAARCIQDRARLQPSRYDVPDAPDHSDLENDVVRRLGVGEMVSRLDERDRELIALRYGADLTSRQVGELLGMKTNAVEVALHRALERLRRDVARPRLVEARLQPSSNIP
jgi:RNA polymerase sigma-70 factor (ECF subfamily)